MSDTSERSEKSVGARVLRILYALAGYEAHGRALSEIARAVGAGAPSVLRDLRMMQREGAVEPVPGLEKHWRLGARVVAIGRQAMVALEARRHQLEQDERNYRVQVGG